jgi:hypothetical protein
MSSTIAHTSGRSTLALAVGFGALLICSFGARAEFVLNWSQPNPDSPAFINTLGCSTPVECSVVHSDFSGAGDMVQVNGQTPFLYERATLNGVEYYHMIVGNPDDGFAQEVFIQVGTGNTFFQAQQLGDADMLSDGGTLPTASSSSLGNPSTQLDFDTGNSTNPFSPDPVFSGNTSGNPNRVQMRQLMTDGDLTVDFVKNVFLDKPSITNAIENDAVRMIFSMDSTGNRYDTSNTPSVVSNRVEHLDPDVPATSAIFDTATDSEVSTVNAGRYTYTPGASATFGFAGGTYEYVDGGANHNPDWGSFFDERLDNPWSFPANCPQAGGCGPAP